ncbi:MAG: YlxR family protein [Actinomycetia bacterium]|nr:YlxR family protein [Actinomycetes bacterium]MCP4225774.1 YlxR family protein [Actinomycetes bacterium]
MTVSRPTAEPERTCIGCRRRAEQPLLVRFVAAEGRLKLGARQPGRGAWLCRHTLIECFDAATERHRWAAALRSKIDVASTAELRVQLSAFLPTVD